MSDRPRTKASYAKSITPVPLKNQYSVLTPPKTFLPLRPQYSALISPSQTYSQVTQKQSPPSPSHTTERTKSSPSKTSMFNPYYHKKCSLTIKLLEQDEIGDNQVPKLSRIFPSVNGKITQYHLPQGLQSPLKTQEYYEFILVDTDSAEITHTPEQNSEAIAYSKLKIKKIITKEEWGNPFQPRTFSQRFQPPQYNYFDYKEAWYKAFFLKPTDHSWFLSFSPKFDRKIPNWTHDWWIYFGLAIEILPEPILSAWNYFNSHLKTSFYGNKSIMFTAEFQVPWIIGWDFAVGRSLDQQYPLILERRFRIKWWKNFQPSERLSLSGVSQWLNTYDSPRQFPKAEKTTTPSPSNKTPSKKDLKKKLLEELSQLGDSDEEEDISSSQPKPAGQLYLQNAQDPYEDYDPI